MQRISNIMGFFFNWLIRTEDQGGLELKTSVHGTKHVVSSWYGSCYFIHKGSIDNYYWTTKASVSFSCLANKLLKLKDIVFPLIKQRLENGLSARFWFNNWTSFGTLASYLDSSTTRLGILLIELLLFVGMELG